MILASGSPRRRELLEGMGVDFRVIEPEIEERPREGEPPASFVRRLAVEKARKVAEVHPSSWVLGADTVVVLEGEIMGKPQGASEAASMLRRLSGKVHQVLTAFALVNLAEGRQITGLETTEVKFVPMDETDIRWYISTGEPLGKAGAYAIQGRGGVFVEWVRGSYSNVVGLPLAQLLPHLKALGLWRPEDGGTGQG